MGYVDTNLIPGESVAYRARLHWIVFAPALLVGLVLDLAGIGLLLTAYLRRAPGDQASVPMIVVAAVLESIAHPHAFRRQVQSQIEALPGSGMGSIGYEAAEGGTQRRQY